VLTGGRLFIQGALGVLSRLNVKKPPTTANVGGFKALAARGETLTGCGQV
jgi:hypothetical protein